MTSSKEEECADMQEHAHEQLEDSDSQRKYWMNKLNICPNIQHVAKVPIGAGKALIYAILCTKNGKLYIGRHVHGSTGLSLESSRWRDHRKGRRGAPCLKRAMVKHGADCFEFFVVEIVDECDVAKRETFWISADGFDTLAPSGYNLKLDDELKTISDEMRKNMSEAAKIRAKRPGEFEARSKRAKKQMAVPGARERVSDKRKAFNSSDAGAKRNEAVSKLMKAKYNEPKKNASLKAIHKKRLQDPKTRESHNARFVANVHNEDATSKRVESLKRFWRHNRNSIVDQNQSKRSKKREHDLEVAEGKEKDTLLRLFRKQDQSRKWAKRSKSGEAKKGSDASKQLYKESMKAYWDAPGAVQANLDHRKAIREQKQQAQLAEAKSEEERKQLMEKFALNEKKRVQLYARRHAKK